MALPINFNSPYKALNIQDFWRRWHITLSRFLRDYVYIPLGGNKKGSFRTYNNLLATFVIGGLWHGAGWTFVFWGFLHGLALIIHRVWTNLGFKMNTILAWFITFNFVNIAWIFFRAKEWDDAIKVLKGMFGVYNIGSIREIIKFGDVPKIDFLLILICFIIAFSSFYFKNSTQNIQKIKISNKLAIYSALLFSISVLYLTKISQFLYFNF